MGVKITDLPALSGLPSTGDFFVVSDGTVTSKLDFANLAQATNNAYKSAPLSCITARIKDLQDVSLTTTYKNLTLENSTSVGSDFTFSDGGVRCEKAGKVMISASAFFTGISDGNVVNLKIERLATDAAFVSNRAVSDRCQLTIPPRLVTCAVGDVFYLAVSNTSAATGSVAGSAIRTWLTVQYVSQ